MSLFQAVSSELQFRSSLDTSLSSFSPSFYAGNLLEPTVIATAPSRSSLVFIDPGVDAYESLIAGVTPGTTVYVLDPLQDAVTQITNTLLGQTGVDSIHIVSHGQSGSLQLGNGQLNLATLPEYASQIQSWSAALTDDADILLYGCDVASGELGQAFVSILSQLTGADVAASDDLTGSSSQGGDWILEFNTGDIETSLVFLTQTTNAYADLLVSITNGGSSTANFTENAAPGIVASGLTITDGTILDGARVSITSNFSAAEDRLGIANQSSTSGTVLGLNWSYNTTTGVLAITGIGPAATYQDALRLVTYSNTSDTPSTAARNLQFSLGSSLANPTNGHFYEFVSAPNISWTAAQAAAAGRNYFGLQGYLVTITSASEQAFVQDKLQGYGWMGANDVATEGDWRWVTGPEGLANGGAGTAFWLGTGTSGGPVNGQYSNWAVIAPNWTANEPNDALTGEDYAHFINGGRWNDYANNTSVQGYVVEYGGMPGDPLLQTTGNITVNVTSVNDIPAIGGTAGTLSYTEGQVATAIASGLTVTDVDSANITGATVQITGNYANGQDILAFANQLGITGSFDAVTGTLTLTGNTTLANYQTALRAITYQNTSNNPSSLTRTVTFTVNDGGAANNLGTATRNITVTSVNTAPVVTSTAGTLTYNDGQAATPIDAGLTLADIDSTNITSATVQITNGYASSQDVLAFTDQLGITGSFNATTGTLTLTGTTTVANYQAALRAITYQNTSNNPNTANRTVTFTVNDGGVSNNNGTATRGIVVTSIDAPSVLTISGTTPPTFTEGSNAVVLAPTLTVTDLDGMTGARVTIANLQTGDVLGIQGQTGSNGAINGLNWSYDANTGILTLSGNATAAVYESTLRLVTYSNTNGAVNATARNIQFSLGATLSNPDNGHFYEFVTASGIDWTEAQTAAANRRLFGLQGYLATITSASEQAFVQSKLQGLGWMGGSDAATEGDWRWVTGPEGLANGGTGTPFWLGTGANGGAVNGQYNNWDTVEPNDSGTGEDYAHFLNGGRWNDYANTTPVQGYVVEYGGMPGDPTLQTTGNITLNISAVNDAPVLDPSGNPTLTAINEDDITTTGTLISTLLSGLGGTGITDPDGGSALKGVAITAVDTTNGSWEFSTNGGTTWTAIGTLSETNTRLLADNPNTRIRFIPAPNYFGTIADAISFRAWDQTTGTNGSTANTSGANSGGTTAFSTAIETAGLTVNPVDDTEFLVTNTADSGNGSLRQAILLANAEAGAETIRFVGNTFTDATADTITLTGELVITDSLTIIGTGANRLTFTANAGEPARIFNVNGPAVVNLSDLAIANGNAGGDNGGAIFNNGGVVSLNRVRLFGNTATSGGAIYNAAGGTVNITNSTLDGNTATTSGAGLANFGTLNLLNVTISGNSSANGSGGGLYNAGAGIASLNFVTLANNTATTGGGINNAAGTVNLRNTLIATNIATNSPDVFGNFTSNGNNLVSRIDGSTGVNQATDIVGTSAAPINAVIAALRTVGGTTSTHRLLPGSPAINAGNNTGAPATDQRGALRTISGRSDIGAFEYSPQPDFNQDGNIDLLWHNSANGQITTWQMNGFSFSTFYLQPPSIPAPWQIVGNADFDGDGDPDVVWRNSVTGQTTIWEMNGFTYSTFRVLANAPADTNWSIAGLADFNGDGSPDIVWRNEQAGLTSLWRMNGFSYSTFSLLPNVDRTWRLERVADFNRDGNPDLIWHNTVDGRVTLWRMNGFSYSTFSVIGNVDANWYVEGAEDFNGDGSRDIVWRNRQTGVNSIWQMNGFSSSTFSALPTIDPSWSVERVADYNNDGSPDLLWYNRSTGRATMWRMNGFSFSTFTTLPNQQPNEWGIFIDS